MFRGRSRTLPQLVRMTMVLASVVQSDECRGEDQDSVIGEQGERQASGFGCQVPPKDGSVRSLLADSDFDLREFSMRGVTGNYL